METWLLLLISICISPLLKPFFNLLFPSKNPSLPPTPFSFRIVSRFLLLRKSLSESELELILRSLHAKLGPIVSLRFGPHLAIFIADSSLAHQALIENGAVFSNRPRPLAVARIMNSNQHNINSASYGPTWRLLRRNLISEILHPSRVKSYTHARKWVLQILQDRVESQAKSGDPVRVLGHFQFAMFCLLVRMCFGDKLDEEQIREVERVERAMILNAVKFNVLNFWPKLTKFVLRKRWEQFLKLRKDQEDVLIPLIRARKGVKDEKSNKDDYVLSYVDTLFDLQLPDENRKLSEDEIVSLCNEFLIAGTDTTSTALQWIMANLVRYPQIQEKLFMEIRGVMRDGDVEEEVKEEDLHKMPYLKAIILEGLRRHPPAHFVAPHSVAEDVVLDKYLIPKNSSINFMVADIGWDPKVWEDPMAFKPERFLNNGVEAETTFDITGNREIKMMPFGVGRRICPGLGLAMLHLEYFVANLIWKFEWKAVDGDEVDLSEKQEFTMVMKNPLQANLSPRFRA